MKGVIYARYSSEKQREESILGQIRDCTAFAKRENIEIVGTYKDEAISGRSDRRPSFQRMIADALRGNFDCIIVWKGDRFSRNRGDSATYKAKLKKHGVKVLYAMEPNVEGPESILMEGINEAYAEFYSAELGVKISRGMRENILQGKWTGGKLPYGYALDKDNRYVINEDEAALVRELYQTYVGGNVSILGISKKWKERGIVNREGKPFHDSVLHHILKRPIYAGMMVYKGEAIEPGIPAIVDKAVFEKAQQKLAENQKIRSSFKGKMDYLLSGIVFDGDTGIRLNADCGKSATGTVYRYYSNRQTKDRGEALVRYPKDLLENAVMECVVTTIKRKPFLEKMRKYVEEYAGKKSPSLERAEKALGDTNTRIGRLTRFIEDGDDFPDIKNRIRELQDLKRRQEEEIQKCRSSGEVITMEEVECYFDMLKKTASLTAPGRRKLIETLVRAVFARSDGNIQVFYNFRDFVGTGPGESLSSLGKRYAPPR